MENKQYENVVSLGFFCSPALEFKKIGVRKASLPFDWLISSEFENVLKLIKNGFEDFLNPEYMYQLKDHPKYYRNVKYEIDFYHDFDEYISFDEQIDAVTQKYKRRIDRFFALIQKPTLFIRYISSQKEAEYIKENYNAVLGFLKEFNEQNDILFVANKEIELANEKVFFVEKDENDTVARKFLDKAPELKQYILGNIAFEPNVIKESRIFKTIKKMRDKLKKYYKKTYHHDKQV